MADGICSRAQKAVEQRWRLAPSIILTDLRRSMFHDDDAAHPAKIDCDAL